MKIIAKNFLSWKNLEFDFNPGVTLIDGFNYDDNTSEGSGKSAIINALCWGLYGKLPKDTKIDDVIKEGENTTKVEIYLDDHIVVRSRNPNRLIFSKGEKSLIGRSATDTQKKIEEFLGLSFKTFVQTIYFPQNSYNKFITAGEEEKARILSEVQDLTEYDEARKTSLLKYNECVDKYTNLKHSQELLLSQSQGKFELIEETELSKDKYVKTIEQTKDGLTQRINSIETKILNFQGDLERLDQIKKELKQYDAFRIEQKEKETLKKELHFKINILNIDCKNTKKDIRLLKENKCPTCDQDVYDEKHLNDVQAGLLEKLDEINKLKSKENSIIVENISVDTDSLFKEKETLERSVYENSVNENLLQDLKRQHEKYANLDLNEYDEKINKNKKDLNNILVKIDKNKKEIEKLQTEIIKYDILKNSFKEIKKYVFESLLSELSIKTNYYASELFNISIQLKYSSFTEDEKINKISTIVIIDGEDRSLGLLSGGQLKRLEIATNLALNEIIANRTTFTFRIFDEPFSGLSEASMAKCVKLFENLPGKTILIEHNSIIKNIVDRVFEIEYRNGTSEIKETNSIRSIH